VVCTLNRFPQVIVTLTRSLTAEAGIFVKSVSTTVVRDCTLNGCLQHLNLVTKTVPATGTP
jgi:hypothetical protein